MSLKVPGFLLQDNPLVYVAKISGNWLLKHVTPSWRIEDPEEGFQRIVNEKRAQKIAKTVLDQKRSFPNAIVLATDSKKIRKSDGSLVLPDNIRFLVVDGQHRLWAQNFSEYESEYSCMIHFGLSEKKMAELFIEINDNQKRVPSSLRWDLVRLVRSDSDQDAVRAVDLIYDLANMEGNPLYGRIDLTGEIKELTIKQGSIAPEVKSIIKKSPISDVGYDIQLNILTTFFSAVRDCDPTGWDNSTSSLFNNRVLRALIRTIPKIINDAEADPVKVKANLFYRYLSHLNLETLDPKEIRTQQGSSGIKAIFDTIISQVI